MQRSLIAIYVYNIVRHFLFVASRRHTTHLFPIKKTLQKATERKQIISLIFRPLFSTFAMASVWRIAAQESDRGAEGGQT